MPLTLDGDEQKSSKDNRGYITIVSGLPRSGTSMMMKMLEAGGMQILTDNVRSADENNPKGYYEFERVKKLKDGDTAWVESAQGKVVKVISALLEHLPRDFHYKVVFMRRDMNEILASQKQMLAIMGQSNGKVTDEQLASIYQKHLQHIEGWLARQIHLDVIYINYNSLLIDPTEYLSQLQAFLKGDLDVEKMRSVIDRNLYRQRGH
jgi:DNA-binding TFAR19-related protein (PDSD5 family)